MLSRQLAVIGELPPHLGLFSRDIGKDSIPLDLRCSPAMTLFREKACVCGIYMHTFALDVSEEEN